uniref:Uncharacterized protein n=1 Tax=Pygocentrus nattereri TaxID=42514 RepID=A0AAR2IL62_PYGNA
MAACAMLRCGLGILESTLMVTKQACSRSLGVLEQVRGYYVDWRMLRDVKRRQMAYEFADTRLRINAIRKNTLLPKELQEVADKEIAALPRDSCPVRIRNSILSNEAQTSLSPDTSTSSLGGIPRRSQASWAI